MKRLSVMFIAILTTTGSLWAGLKLECNEESVSCETYWQVDDTYQYERIPVSYARVEAGADDVWSIQGDDKMNAWKVLPEGSVEIIESTRGKLRFQLSHPVEHPTHLAILSGRKRLLYLFLDPPGYQSIPDHAINVTSLGIHPNGDRLVSETINEALIKLSENGGGTLYFPSGIYPIATILMQDNTSVFLDEGAVLQGSLNPEAYPLDPPEYENKDLPRSLRPGHLRRLIYFDHVENAAIRGKGVIDAQGSEWRKRTMPGNRAYLNHIRMVGSKNITLEGIILRDSEFWSTHLLLCDNITIDGVKIVNEIAPPQWDRFLRPKSNSIWNNADGINPDSSSNVSISNVFFHTGDDCLPIKNTSSYKGKLSDVRNITARSCMMITSSTAMKLGTETLGNQMKDILFEDIEVVSASRVISTDLKDGLTASNITYRNIRVFECNRPFDFWIILRRDHPDQKEFSNLRDVLVENLSIINYAKNKDGGEVSHLLGRDANHTVEDITFRNVVIEGKRVTDMTFPAFETNEFAKGIHFE